MAKYAKDQNNKRIIEASEYGTLWKKDSPGFSELVHPRTGERLTHVKACIRNGKSCRPYFRSMPHRNSPWPDKTVFDPEKGFIKNGVPYIGGESKEHLEGKELVAKYAIKRRHATVEMEKTIQISSDKYRRPDLWLTHPDGKEEAVEVQLSLNSDKYFESKANDYMSKGIAYRYVLGGEAANSARVKRCIKECCGHFDVIQEGNNGKKLIKTYSLPEIELSLALCKLLTIYNFLFPEQAGALLSCGVPSIKGAKGWLTKWELTPPGEPYVLEDRYMAIEWIKNQLKDQRSKMPPWQKYNLLEDHIKDMIEAALHPRLHESIEETQEVWGREELSIDEQIRIAVEKDNWQENRRRQYS